MGQHHFKTGALFWNSKMVQHHFKMGQIPKGKVNKPNKDPVNDHQLDSDENSLKPEVNNNKLEIEPKTKVKDDTKPKTEVIGETTTEVKGKT